jgi:hypothetical protein
VAKSKSRRGSGDQIRRDNAADDRLQALTAERPGPNFGGEKQATFNLYSTLNEVLTTVVVNDGGEQQVVIAGITPFQCMIIILSFPRISLECDTEEKPMNRRSGETEKTL